MPLPLYKEHDRAGEELEQDIVTSHAADALSLFKSLDPHKELRCLLFYLVRILREASAEDLVEVGRADTSAMAVIGTHGRNQLAGDAREAHHRVCPTSVLSLLGPHRHQEFATPSDFTLECRPEGLQAFQEVYALGSKKRSQLAHSSKWRLAVPRRFCSLHANIP